jgi:hypothetical protein
MGRRSFLGAIGLGMPVATFGAQRLSESSAVEGGRPGLKNGRVDRGYGGFPQHDPERVAAVVGASHFDLDRVRALIEEQPALAKASWDWGFGDWETALGAASHTGRREIAELLIAHGARPTVFSAAMMGEVDTVRAFLTAEPDLFLLHGPHGISLTNHARAGGTKAEPVLDYLLETFGPDERPFGVPGDPELEARYGGRYRFDTAPVFQIAVGVRRDWLMVGVGEQPLSRVLRVDEDVFHPTGAPAVRLEFDVREERAESLTIIDGPNRVTGDRVV